MADEKTMLTPTVSLLVKLGSIAVHIEELQSDDGHAFDRIAVQSLLNDPEVVEWVRHMDKAGFLPKKRKDRT